MEQKAGLAVLFVAVPACVLECLDSVVTAQRSSHEMLGYDR